MGISVNQYESVMPPHMWNFYWVCELPPANFSNCSHCAADEACHTQTHTYTHIRSQIVSSEAVRELLIYIYHRLTERVLGRNASRNPKVAAIRRLAIWLDPQSVCLSAVHAAKTLSPKKWATQKVTEGEARQRDRQREREEEKASGWGKKSAPYAAPQTKTKTGQ